MGTAHWTSRNSRRESLWHSCREIRCTRNRELKNLGTLRVETKKGFCEEQQTSCFFACQKTHAKHISVLKIYVWQYKGICEVFFWGRRVPPIRFISWCQQVFYCGQFQTQYVSSLGSLGGQQYYERNSLGLPQNRWRANKKGLLCQPLLSCRKGLSYLSFPLLGCLLVDSW